jgi:hypothetical protein
LTSFYCGITMPAMRTTINLDDTLLERARLVAQRSRISLREALNRALAFGLDRMDPASRKRPYRATTHSMGFPPSPNMDKALQLAALLEDEETARELTLRK